MTVFYPEGAVGTVVKAGVGFDRRHSFASTTGLLAPFPFIVFATLVFGNNGAFFWIPVKAVGIHWLGPLAVFVTGAFTASLGPGLMAVLWLARFLAILVWAKVGSDWLHARAQTTGMGAVFTHTFHPAICLGSLHTVIPYVDTGSCSGQGWAGGSSASCADGNSKTIAQATVTLTLNHPVIPFLSITLAPAILQQPVGCASFVSAKANNQYSMVGLGTSWFTAFKYTSFITHYRIGIQAGDNSTMFDN